MTTIRWGVITAIGAFIISFGLGLIAGNQFLRVFLTAFVFGLVFFGVGFGVRIMINNFFPELLFMDNQPETNESYEEETPRTAIALDNSGEYAVPEMYRIPGKDPEIGNIEDLISGSFTSHKETIDSKPEEGYNISTSFFEETAEEIPAPQPAPQPQVFTPSFGNDEGLGGLPDLDVMAMAFSATTGEGAKVPDAPAVSAPAENYFYGASEMPTEKQEESMPDRSQYKGNKSQAMEGDFDAKQIAQGIRTVLSKDK